MFVKTTLKMILKFSFIIGLLCMAGVYFINRTLPELFDEAQVTDVRRSTQSVNARGDYGDKDLKVGYYYKNPEANKGMFGKVVGSTKKYVNKFKNVIVGVKLNYEAKNQEKKEVLENLEE